MCKWPHGNGRCNNFCWKQNIYKKSPCYLCSHFEVSKSSIENKKVVIISWNEQLKLSLDYHFLFVRKSCIRVNDIVKLKLSSYKLRWWRWMTVQNLSIINFQNVYFFQSGLGWFFPLWYENVIFEVWTLESYRIQRKTQSLPMPWHRNMDNITYGRHNSVIITFIPPLTTIP